MELKVNFLYICVRRRRCRRRRRKMMHRREMFAEDASLMSLDNREKKWPWAILDKDKNMLTRPLPDLFDVYKVQIDKMR